MPLTMYVPVWNHRAVPQVTTGFAANFPVHNCLDANFDSYAYPSAAAFSITIDTDGTFGTYSAVGYSYVWLWILNDPDELVAVPYLQIKLESSTDAAFTTPSDWGTMTIDAVSKLPLVLWDLSTAQSDRYLRFTFSNSTIKTKVAAAQWGYSFGVSGREPEWEHTRSERYFNKTDEMGAGREISRNYRSIPLRRIQRPYRMVPDSVIATMKTVMKLVRGRWWPFIIQMTEFGTEYVPVKFASDDFSYVPVQYDLNDYVFDVVEVAHIDPALQQEW